MPFQSPGPDPAHLLQPRPRLRWQASRGLLLQSRTASDCPTPGHPQAFQGVTDAYHQQTVFAALNQRKDPTGIPYCTKVPGTYSLPLLQVGWGGGIPYLASVCLCPLPSSPVLQETPAWVNFPAPSAPGHPYTPALRAHRIEAPIDLVLSPPSSKMKWAILLKEVKI